jgi:hypothetical protein
VGLFQTEVCIAETSLDIPLTNAILKRMGGLGALTPQSCSAVQIYEASQRIACLPVSTRSLSFSPSDSMGHAPLMHACGMPLKFDTSVFIGLGRLGWQDSLPVLGPAMYTRPNVICNFGHGHQSLCMASGAAAVLTDLVAQRQPRVPLKPYAPNRKW